MTFGYPIITSTTNLQVPIPGQYTIDTMAGVGISNKYTVDPAATVFTNGFFVGRTLTSAATYTVATSLDQIITPAIANILGCVAVNNLSEMVPGISRIGSTIVQWATSANYSPNSIFNLANKIPGMIFVWSGSAIAPGDALYVYFGTAVADADSNMIYPGTLVSATWVAANISLTSIIDVSSNVKVNAQYNLQTFVYGSLVPVTLDFINR